MERQGDPERPVPPNTTASDWPDESCRRTHVRCPNDCEACGVHSPPDRKPDLECSSVRTAQQFLHQKARPGPTPSGPRCEICTGLVPARVAFMDEKQACIVFRRPRFDGRPDYMGIWTLIPTWSNRCRRLITT